MHPRISTVLSFVLLPAFCSASYNDVYLHPPVSLAIQSTSPAVASALLARHLRLDAFLPSVSSQDAHGEIPFGGPSEFVGEGARDALVLSVDASNPQDVIPAHLHPSLRLSTDSNAATSLLQQYARVAWRQYHAVFESSSHPPPRPVPALLDIFSLSDTSSPMSNVLEKFLGSLASLVAFLEESRDDETGDRFGAFDLTGLLAIETQWGRDSEVYQSAAAALKATIHSATSETLSLAVIFSPQSQLHPRQPPQLPLPTPAPGIPDTAPVFSTSTCFVTASACNNATSSCSSRGKCTGVTRAGRTCFVCECRKAPLEEGGKNVSWAGSMCHKKDISQQFTLLTGTVLFLILVSMGSIMLLYTVGTQELPGTLTGGLGGPIKRE